MGTAAGRHEGLLGATVGPASLRFPGWEPGPEEGQRETVSAQEDFRRIRYHELGWRSLCPQLRTRVGGETEAHRPAGESQGHMDRGTEMPPGRHAPRAPGRGANKEDEN